MPRKEPRKFENTSIHWTRSQADIVRFLQKQSISNVRFTNSEKGIALEFVAVAKEINRPIPIRMAFPTPKNDEKETNRLHRVLWWYLTNKFEALKSGLVEEITKEFLPFIVYKTKNGVDTTLYEALKEHPEEILGGDTTFPLLPGR